LQEWASRLSFAAAVSVGPLALWLASRTVGLPFGPEPGAAESIGLPDLAVEGDGELCAAAAGRCRVGAGPGQAVARLDDCGSAVSRHVGLAPHAAGASR
jgi:hypothetical protein